jgi:hypothetical protein
MKTIDLSDLKAGDKAWSAMYGDVNVTEKNHEFIRVGVKKELSTYYVNGNFCKSDVHPTLFHSEQEFREYWLFQESSTLTKREQFAMAAMQGMLTNPFWNDYSFDEQAEVAAEQADALLTKLNETP